MKRETYFSKNVGTDLFDYLEDIMAYKCMDDTDGDEPGRGCLYMSQEDYNKHAQKDIDYILGCIEAPKSVIFDLYDNIFELLQLQKRYFIDRDSNIDAEMRIAHHVFNEKIWLLTECGLCPKEPYNIVDIVDELCYSIYNNSAIIERPTEWYEKQRV